MAGGEPRLVKNTKSEPAINASVTGTLYSSQPKRRSSLSTEGWNHMDSKKIVSMSRSIVSKGEAKPGEKAKGTKTGNPKTTETRGQTKIRDQYSHYMFQRNDEVLNRSILKYHIIAIAIKE